MITEGMEYFQYKGFVFAKADHCPTCSQNKAKRSMNSTATLSFGDKCNHRKTTKIMFYDNIMKPNPSMRTASENEKIIIDRDYNI